MGSLEEMQMQRVMSRVQHTIAAIKWRLKPKARQRLALDMIALCTCMRPAVMIDYAGMMPQLQQWVSKLVDLILKEQDILPPLKVMIISDNLFLVHVHSLQDFMQETVNRTFSPKFVIQENDSLRFACEAEEDEFCKYLTSFQKQLNPILEESDAFGSTIDLSRFSWADDIPLPTLNGWLLSYPIVYSFEKEKVSEFTRCLSASSLYLVRVMLRSDLRVPYENSKVEELGEQELMSFTVPSSCGVLGMEEAWVSSFKTYLECKMGKVPNVWKYLKLDVSLQTCPAVAL